MTCYNRQHIEAFLVFFSLTTLLVLASRTFGLTWDESIYFQFSDSIRTWFLHDRSFDPETIAAYWSYSDYHNPHPPFMKILGAISSHWFGDALPYPTAYRLANILYVSACLAVVYRLLAPRFSTPAALAAIGLAAFQPRVFGHLLIAGTDSPVAMSWLVLPLIAWRLQQAPPRSRRVILRILLSFFSGQRQRHQDHRFSGGAAPGFISAGQPELAGILLAVRRGDIRPAVCNLRVAAPVASSAHRPGKVPVVSADPFGNVHQRGLPGYNT